jgi:LacI family transcriptional regulator
MPLHRSEPERLACCVACPLSLRQFYYGFVPSIAASGLAAGRSRLLGALVPSLTWPLVPELMRGVGEVVGSTSYELILYSITDVNHEKDRSDVIDRIVGTRLAAGLLAVFPLF